MPPTGGVRRSWRRCRSPPRPRRGRRAEERTGAALGLAADPAVRADLLLPAGQPEAARAAARGRRASPGRSARRCRPSSMLRAAACETRWCRPSRPPRRRRGWRPRQSGGSRRRRRRPSTSSWLPRSRRASRPLGEAPRWLAAPPPSCLRRASASPPGRELAARLGEPAAPVDALAAALSAASSGSPRRWRRAHQSPGCRPALPERQDRRLPPPIHLPQAGHPLGTELATRVATRGRTA